MNITDLYANLEHYGSKAPDGAFVQGFARVETEGDISVLPFSMDCVAYPYDYCRTFRRDSAVCITLDLGQISQYMGQHCYSPFWAVPVFGSDWDGAEKELQFYLGRGDRGFVFLLPLAGENYQASAVPRGNRLELRIHMESAGQTHVSGVAALAAWDSDPYRAIEKGFASVYEQGWIQTPLRQQKKYPDVLRKIGWCSWDAFYHDVTEEKLLAKLEEFRQKQIPVKWILIDDGWSECDEMKLKSMYEDRRKFPRGLKHTVRRMKEEYGIEKVGVWHSLTGYWFGLESAQEDTVLSCQDRQIPAGCDFFRRWHGYLAEQGVDFIKVDCQGNAWEFLKNRRGAQTALSRILEGLEQSAGEHFDFMINCMGMKSLLALNHKSSVLLRSSDDFYPRKENSFLEHARNNIYNAVFYGALFFCDYDMWWSQHLTARQSAVLRFLSGGPVYTSDELGATGKEFITLFAREDGSFPVPDTALRPSYDQLFGFDQVLKGFVRLGDQYALTAFTFGQGAAVTVSAGDFGESGTYRVREFFSGRSYILGEGDKREVPLPENDAEIFFFEKAE